MNREVVKSLTVAACLVCASFNSIDAAPVSPISPGDIIFTTGGVDNWHKLDPATGVVTSLARWNTFPYSPWSTIEFDADGSILYDALGDVYQLNPWTGNVEPLNIHFAGGDSFNFGFVVEDNGDLLIAHDHFIGRFSRSTQSTSAVTGRPGMSPRGIAQDENGRVFVLESDRITEVDPDTSGRSLIADLSTMLFQRLIDAQPNGRLIVGGSAFDALYTVDILSGTVDVFSDQLPLFVRDFATDQAGSLWLTSNEGIYRYSSAGGAGTLITDRVSGLGPELIAVVPLDWTPPPIPEPTGLVLILCSMFGVGLRRNR